jgi:hypothetical protein
MLEYETDRSLAAPPAARFPRGIPTPCNTMQHNATRATFYPASGSRPKTKILHKNAQSAPSPQALSFPPSAFSQEPGVPSAFIGVHRRPIWFFANERTPCSATKPLEIVAPRKEFEV